MAHVVERLMACVDCLNLVANGEPSDDNPHHERDIQDHLSLTPHQWLECGDDGKDWEFSWHSCECCGSTLGGSRHELVVLG